MAATLSEPRATAPRNAERVAAGVYRRQPQVWLWLSVPIAVLAVAASLAGILVDGTYANETDNWTSQAIGQDLVNVFVAYPALLLLAFAAARGSLRAFLAWLGVLGYSVYSYTIYAFSIHFGRLFLVYVAVLGLSVYALVGGLASLDPDRVKARFSASAPVRSTAALLIGLGAIFALLWLSGIVPATIDNSTPQELVEVGLPSNPVHVIDLAVFLPAMVLTGVLLARRRGLGYCLAPPVLITAILLGLAIVVVQPVLAARDEAASWGVAGVIGVVVALELLVLVRFLRAADRSVSRARLASGG